MNFNAGPVQNQCHTVQKGHVFTSTFPEVPQNMEVWDWWSQDQRVWTPILNRVNLAVEVNDSGASHSACGVRHAAGRKKGNKQEWKNITRCCWTPNQWGRDILYIFINWIQLNFLYIAPNHKHRLRPEYPSVGTSKKVITDVSLKYKYRYIYMPLPSQRSRGPQPEICSAAVSEQVRLEQVSRSELSTAPYSCKPPEMSV